MSHNFGSGINLELSLPESPLLRGFGVPTPRFLVQLLQPFTACNDNAPPQPRWRYLGRLLLLAWLARLLVGLSSDWIYRPDEIWSYLEQAHRLVFGYGVTAYDYVYALRNWLPVLSLAAVIWLCDQLGFGQPWIYIPAVKIYLATVSLILPLGVYYFLHRQSEAAARIAFVFCCFWWELVVLAPHALPSANVAYLIVAALWLFSLVLMRPGAKIAAMAAAGFCLALAGLLRPSYLPAAAFVGLCLLLARERWQVLWLFGGGIAALVFYGWVDYLFWGKWWVSIINILKVTGIYTVEYHQQDNISSLQALWQGTQWGWWQLTACSFGLYPLLFIAALRQGWRYSWCLLALVIVYVSHAWHNIYYSYLYLMFPLFAILLGGLLAARERESGSRAASVLSLPMAALALVGAVSVAGITGQLHSLTKVSDYPPRYLFYQYPDIAIMKKLARLPAEKVKAVVWYPYFSSWPTGNYYYFHHRVPLYYQGFVSGTDHRALFRGSNLPLHFLASHVIAFESVAPTLYGFEIKARITDAALELGAPEPIVLLENTTDTEIIMLKKYDLRKPGLIEDILAKEMQAERRSIGDLYSDTPVLRPLKTR